MRQSVLLIDKQGALSPFLFSQLIERFFCVVVSSKKPQKIFDPTSSLYIYYKQERKRVPIIPSYDYQYVFIVYSGEKEVCVAAEEFLESASQKSQCIFISEQEYIQDVLQRFEGRTNCFFFVLGDSFYEKEFPYRNLVVDILYQAKVRGSVYISKTGTSILHPVYLPDAIESILEKVFEQKNLPAGRHGEGSIFHVFSEHGITELSFVRMLQKLQPLIAIDFTHDTYEEKISLSPKEKYLISASYPLKERVRQFLESDSVVLKEEKNASFKNSKKKNSVFSRYIMWIIGVLLISIISPWILFMTCSFFGFTNLMEVKNTLEKGLFTQSKNHAQNARQLFSVAHIFSPLLLYEGTLINQKEVTTQVIDSIETGKEISSALSNIFNSMYAFLPVFLGNSKNPSADFLQATSSITDSLITFQKLIIEEKAPVFVKNTLTALESKISLLEQTIAVFPQVFGVEGSKTYLFLFQNNMELRPTGGFIGSYGLLKLTRGKINSFSISDVYDADGKLKGHIEPPLFLKKYMGASHLFLRDSNFDIDFPKSASMSAFLFREETGIPVDGVIGVDLYLAKNILKAIGPVMVPDYNREVNENNMYELTQNYAEKDFFPGSTQKKDFLRFLFSALQNKLVTSHSYNSLLDAFYKSLLEKHIIFAFADEALERPFVITGLSASLPKDLQQENSISDFIGINEANIGGNKANYFITRTVFYESNITKEGSISGVLTIQYKNNSSQNGKNDYKQYLRVIVPQSSELTAIEIDGVKQYINSEENRNNKKQNALEVETYEESGKKIYGFLVTVLEGVDKKVVLQYKTSQPLLNTYKDFVYPLTVLKQPGTDADTWKVSVKYPDEAFTPTAFSKELHKDQGGVGGKFELRKDTVFKINFSRK